MAKFDQSYALQEGWGVFNGFEIQRVDENSEFPDDLQALKHVAMLALLGSAYHEKAMVMLRKGIFDMPLGRFIDLYGASAGMKVENTGAIDMTVGDASKIAIQALTALNGNELSDQIGMANVSTLRSLLRRIR